MDAVTRIALFVTSALPCLLVAQVHVDGPIQLNGATTDQRQVTGLPPSVVATDALSASTEQTGAGRLGSSALNDWAFTVPGLNGLPIPGTALVLRAPAPAPGSVQLHVNGLGPYPLTYGPSGPVDGMDLIEGTMLSVIFDGSDFQLMNGSVHRLRDCPTGLVPVTEQFCISQAEHVSGNRAFFPAIEACAAQGLRLCTWGEWYTACANQVALGLQAMVGNWEWTNDAANEDNSARWAGQGSCAATGGSSVTVATRFRCCFTR